MYRDMTKQDLLNEIEYRGLKFEEKPDTDDGGRFLIAVRDYPYREFVLGLVPTGRRPNWEHMIERLNNLLPGPGLIYTLEYRLYPQRPRRD